MALVRLTDAQYKCGWIFADQQTSASGLSVFRTEDPPNSTFGSCLSLVVRPSVRPKLQQLPPAGPFQAVLRLERRITRDGMVSVDGNLYSVPNSARRRVVEVHNTANEVRIVEAGLIIAVHPVLDGRGQRRILAGHRSLPPPANSQTPRNGVPGRARSGDIAALRSRAFYDAVGGVTGRFVQNRTLSGARQERSRNVAYWPKAGDGAAVSPDVNTGQCDVLPSERGDVCEEIIGDDGSLYSNSAR